MADLDYNKVILLLHCNGEPGSDVFVDNGWIQHSLQAANGAEINTERSMFGGASMYLNGAGAFLSADPNPSFNMGSEDFTIEMFVYRTTNNGMALCCNRFDGATGWSLSLGGNGATAYRGVIGGTWIDGFNATPAGSVPINTWTHLAFVRYGDDWRTYVNGVSSVTSQASGALSFVADMPFLVGVGTYNTAETPFQGWMDEFRITKGLARYTTDFTPPVVPFEDKVTEDPLFDLVVLFLNGQGANNSTSFPDIGGWEKEVMVNGGAVISTQQKIHGASAMYFNGTGAFLTVPDTTFFYPNVALTVEGWIYPEQLNVTQRIAGFANSSGGETCWTVLINSDNRIGIGGTDGASYKLAYSTTLAQLNTWMHIAAVCEGNLFKIYINGVLEGTSPEFGTLMPINSPLSIGRVGNYDGQYFKGFINNFKITNDAVRYTENFTPTFSLEPATSQPPVVVPPSLDPFYANVVLLMSGDGADGSGVFTDGSATPMTVTGNASISTTQSKFGGSSMYFDGTGKHLTVIGSNSADFYPSANFTVEMWSHTSEIGRSQKLIGSGAGMPWGGEHTWVLIQSGNNKFYFGGYDNVSYKFAESTTVAEVGKWVHVAGVVIGNVFKIYINGVLEGTSPEFGTLRSLISEIYIGRADQANPEYFNGYIDNLRITQGVARYTENFIPEGVINSPIEVPVTYDEHYAFVSLLLHGDGANGGLVFTDHSNYVKQLLVYSDANLSTAQSKFGGASMYFGGSEGCAVVNYPSAEFDFGAGDFTVECSVFITGGIDIYRPIAGNTRGWTLMVDSDQGGLVSFGCVIAGDVVVVTSYYPPALNQWVTIAVVREANNLVMYIDGELNNVTYITGSIQNSNQQLGIGGNSRGSAAAVSLGTFQGYIDELRITKGVARYSGPYTIATQPFGNSASVIQPNNPLLFDPYYNNVALLLHTVGNPNTSVFVDSSPYESDIENTLAKNIYAIANPTIPKHSTDAVLFAPTSAYFPLNSVPLLPPVNSLYSFNRNDFTIEFAVYVNSGNFANNQESNIFSLVYGSMENPDTLKIGFTDQTTGGRLGFSITSDDVNLLRVTEITRSSIVDTWYRFAMVRKDNKVFIYQHGYLVGTSLGQAVETDDAFYIDSTNIATPHRVIIGGASDIYLSEIRVTKGVARYGYNDTAWQNGDEQYSVDTVHIFPDQQSVFSTDEDRDPYYDNVILLLHTSSEPGDTVFVDSSKNNQLIGNPNAAIHSSTQIKYAPTSAYFPVGSNPLNLQDFSNFNFGTGDFTIEFALYLNDVYLPDRSDTIFLMAYGENASLFHIGFDASPQSHRLEFSVNQDTVHLTGFTHNYLVGSWHQFAMVRRDGEVRVYVNGQIVFTGLGSSQYTENDSYIDETDVSDVWRVRIGTVEKYLTEFRVTKGVARYWSAYTPPARRFSGLTPFALPQGPIEQPDDPNLRDIYLNNVVLLMHTVGNESSTEFIDAIGGRQINNSLVENPYLEEYSTLVTHSGESFLFPPTSAYFSTTSIALRPEIDLGYSVGIGDFTIEFAVYVNSGNVGNTLSDIFRLKYGNPDDENELRIGFGSGLVNGRLEFSVNSQTADQTHCILDTRADLVGAWYRFAMVRQRGVVSIYKDSVLVATAIGASSITDTAYGDLTNISDVFEVKIGGESDLYLSEIRFTKGVARYNRPEAAVAHLPAYAIDHNAIFPSYEETLAVDADIDQYYGNVVLLLRGADGVGSPTFEDSSQYEATFTALPGEAIGALQALYSPSSIYFPISAPPLELSNASRYAFGSGDFTIEFALYVNSGYISDGSSSIFAIEFGTGDDALVMQIAFDSDAGSGRMMFCVSNFDETSQHRTSDTRDTLVGEWYQFAMVRSSGMVSVYKDGMLINTGNNAGVTTPDDTYFDDRAINDVTRVRVGSGDLYISELRVTAGIARYLGDYTPPTRRFSGLGPYVSTIPPGEPEPDQYYANVVLLMHTHGTQGVEEFFDSSRHDADIRNQGINRIDSTRTLFSPTSAYFPSSITGYYDFGSFPLKPDVLQEYNVGAGDFTLEFSVYIEPQDYASDNYSNDGYGNLFTILYGVPGTGEGSLSVSFDDERRDGRLGFSINANLVENVHSTQYTRDDLAGAWHQFAMVRSDGLVKIYKAGSLQNFDSGSDTGYASNAYYDYGDISSVFEVQVGGNGNTYMTEIRFTEGIARYLGEYTPDTTIFGHGDIPIDVTLESRLVEFATAVGNDISILDARSRGVANDIEGINAGLSYLENQFGTPTYASAQSPVNDAPSTGLSFLVSPYDHPYDIPQYGLQIRRGFNYDNLVQNLQFDKSRSNPNTTSVVTTVPYSQLDNRIVNGTVVYWQARYIDLFGKAGEWSQVATYTHYDSEGEIP